MIVKYARNVFIDSEINQVGNGEQIKLNFPSSSFNVKTDERMKLTLTTFEFRKNWYDVNPSNNTFYWYDPSLAPANQYTPLVLEPGNYETFAPTAPAGATPPLTLGDAIINAINAHAPLTGATMTFNLQKRKYTIDLTGSAGPLNANSRFVAFQVKRSPNAPQGVSDNGYFNDFHELIGGYPTRDGWTAPLDLFTGSTAGGAVATTQTTPFVAQLDTLEALYIRTSLHSGNYQTYGFEKDLPNQQGLTPTQIFARVPYLHTEQERNIVFEDTNNLFTMFLHQTQLSQVYFSVTDDKGRLIEEVAPDQAKVGSLSYKMSFRWEIIEDEDKPDENRLKLNNLQRKYPDQVMN